MSVRPPATPGEFSSGLIRLPPWAQVSADRRAHIERVGALIDSWADDMCAPATERDRWLTAVSLHDSLKDAPDAELSDLADDTWGVRELRHGPAAAVMAERNGERDEGILTAVRFHSVGFRDWDSVGQLLYLADALEPGRAHCGDAEATLAARVPHDVQGVLRVVASQRLSYIVRSGMALLPETVDFWNGLACGA